MLISGILSILRASPSANATGEGSSQIHECFEPLKDSRRPAIRFHGDGASGCYLSGDGAGRSHHAGDENRKREGPPRKGHSEDQGSGLGFCFLHRREWREAPPRELLGIEYFAFWGQHEKAFKLFAEHDLRPQIWQTLGAPGKSSQAENILAATDASRPLAIRTAKLGCRLGLYNHGGWGGEPGNLVAVCQALHKEGHRHVGIVYNWHHGHERIKHWAHDLKQMLPYLHCINLNGMNTAAKPKILPIGQGEHDLTMLRAIISAGYQGPIGILDHQPHLDTREALQDNLEGLAWLTREIIEPGSGGPRPTPKASPIPK